MGFRSYVKNTVKANTNVKGWTGWDVVKNNANVIKNFADDLKAPETRVPPVQITFEEAMKKYGLTESDVQRSMRNHFITACVCLVLCLAAFLWTFHLLWKGMILSGLVSLSLSALMGAYGFSEHFYYFQMKRRKLNVTLSEWASNFLSFKR